MTAALGLNCVRLMKFAMVGTHATVVRPKALAERMRHTARNLLQRYDSLLAESA